MEDMEIIKRNNKYCYNLIIGLVFFITILSGQVNTEAIRGDAADGIIHQFGLDGVLGKEISR